MEYEIKVLIGIFKDFKNKINRYKYPEELFGELKGNSSGERLTSLKGKFKKLLKDYNADKYNHYDNQELFDLSSDIDRRIIEFENMAEDQIGDGTYGTKNNSMKNFSVISVGNRRYRIYELIVRGDFVDIFRGEFGNNGSVEPILIKMARNSDDDGYLLDSETIRLNNDSITNEIRVLKYLDSIKDTDFQKVRPIHYPILLDKFGFTNLDSDSGNNTEERHALVLKYFDGCDFVTLKEKFENGVPLYHACWMMERALSAIGYLNFNKILLGNIVPSGICVIPQDHNVILSDYTFSVMDYTSKQAKYIGFTDNYTAPEVIKKAAPNPRSDIYSLGMNMVYILGGDVEKNMLPDSFEMIPGQKVDMDGIERIRNLILSFINKHPLARYNDAWKAYHQLRDLRKDAFGEAQFIEFKIPG